MKIPPCAKHLLFHASLNPHRKQVAVLAALGAWQLGLGQTFCCHCWGWGAWPGGACGAPYCGCGWGWAHCCSCGCWGW